MISFLTAQDFLDVLFAKGMTVSDIARGVGVFPSTISRLQAGAKPRAATYAALRRLAVEASEDDVKTYKFLVARMGACMAETGEE